MGQKQAQDAAQEMPLVSVIIPAYNQAHFLQEAVDSVLAQSYPRVEIIVVDDASTDATAVVAARYKERIRYIWQENQGLAAARNTGILAARGRLVALLDSDDAWLPTYLEKMMALAASRPQAAVFYCNVRYMDAAGHNLPQNDNARIVAPAHLYDALLRANFLVPSTILMRRDDIVTGGLFDSAFRRLQDWECWLRLLRQGIQFAGLADRLVRYRVHGSSLSTDPQGGQQAALAMAGKLFGPDDGRASSWPADKRRVYGGVYRYMAINTIQRQGKWPQAAAALRQALLADPTLAGDLDLFYELALGTQPLGQRGSGYALDIDASAALVKDLLSAAFTGAPPALAARRRRTQRTADFALGLVAYNAGQMSASRRWLWSALLAAPVWPEPRLLATLLKAILGRGAVGKMRAAMRQARRAASRLHGLARPSRSEQ